MILGLTDPDVCARVSDYVCVLFGEWSMYPLKSNTAFSTLVLTCALNIILYLPSCGIQGVHVRLRRYIAAYRN